MSYTPKTEEQLAEETLLPEGIYDFEVIDTDDRPSKKGNEMITLKLCVFDGDGGQRHIYDYMAFGNSFGERKFRHAAVACGLLDIYNSGNLQHYTFIGACGKVLLKKQNGTDDFPMPKNVVSDYVERDDSVSESTTPKISKEIIDDDIPF
jgi:hypothetical protein